MKLGDTVYRGYCTLRILDTTANREGLDRLDLVCEVLEGKITTVERNTGAAWVKWKGVGSQWRYAEERDLQATRAEAVLEMEAQYERLVKVLVKKWDAVVDEVRKQD